MPVPPAALQERSRRTQRAILDAAARLLQEHGPEALTIAAVSALANVAGATVYRRFGDKEGLLAAIQAEFTEGIRSEYGRRLSSSGLGEGASAADATRLAVRGLAETVRAHENLLRVFAVLGLRDERVFAVGSRASHEGGRLFRDLLWPYRDEFTGGDPEAAIDMAYRLVYAAYMHRVLHGPNLESPTPVTWEQLTKELGRAVVLYLLGSAPEQDLRRASSSLLLTTAREESQLSVVFEQFVHRVLAFAQDCVILRRGTVAWSGPAAEAASISRRRCPVRMSAASRSAHADSW